MLYKPAKLYLAQVQGLLLVCIACGMLLTGCDEKQEAAPEQTRPQVSIVTVQSERLVLTTELPGRTSAFRVADIHPQVSGLIQKRLFTEGADVEAGQALYQIDSAPFQAAYNNAKAYLERAQASRSATQPRAKRMQELLAAKAVSQQDYDDAQAALDQAEAEIEYWKASLETARINLGYTTVKAPISGRIGRSNVTEGAIVTAYQQTALATIQQINPIYVDVPQSTVDLLRLRRSIEAGQLQNGGDHNMVQLVQEDGTPYTREGELLFSDVTVDQSTGSVTLRAVFPNPDSVLLPGMFVRTIIREGIDEQAILLPQQCVSRDPKGNPYAMVVGTNDTVEQRMVTLDRALGDKWLISAGLVPGERVVIEGLQRLRHGMQVATIEYQAPRNTADTGREPLPTAGDKK